MQNTSTVRFVRETLALANTVSALVLVLLIRLYQYVVSPILGPRCRFYPSCSDYAIDAVKGRGVVRGFCLSVTRLCKCHPWHEGGYDPVPPPVAPERKQGV